jgi:hypothetical protein
MYVVHFMLIHSGSSCCCFFVCHMFIDFFIYSHFFCWILGKLHPWKAYFVGPGERIKLRLSQALIRGARPDSNSRPAVQISSPLPPRYAYWEQCYHSILFYFIFRMILWLSSISFQPVCLNPITYIMGFADFF